MTLTHLNIHWFRTDPLDATHAFVLRPGASEPTVNRAGVSPVCHHPNSSIGGARWTESLYGKRCQECIATLTRLLHEVITVPTEPVLVRFEISVLVEPEKVDHALDLIRAYASRTPTLNQCGTAPDVRAVVKP